MGAGRPTGEETCGARAEGLDALITAVTPGDRALNGAESAVVEAFYLGETAGFDAKSGARIAAAVVRA